MVLLHNGTHYLAVTTPLFCVLKEVRYMFHNVAVYGQTMSAIPYVLDLCYEEKGRAYSLLPLTHYPQCYPTVTITVPFCP